MVDTGRSRMSLTYFATVIADSSSPTLMAAIYQAATETDLPRCRWPFKRHQWEQIAERGSVRNGETTGRAVVCRRCKTGFSVGSFGWQTWLAGRTKRMSEDAA